MKLAYLTTQYPKASHTFIRRELQALERRGHEVVRIAIRRPEARVVDPADLEEDARTFHCLAQPSKRLLKATLREAVRAPLAFLAALRRTLAMGRTSHRGLLRHIAYLAEACLVLEHLRDQQVEHVHVHFGSNAAAVARLVRRLGGPRYSMTVHGPDEFDSPVGYSLAGKIEDAAFVVGVCSFGSAQLRRWVDPAHWPKIHVVRCAVDERFLGPVEPIAENADELLCIGRLSAQKGQVVLVDAMAELVKEGFAGRLVLAGDGELRGAIERRIAEHGLGHRVEITGWVDEARVRALLARCRCVVLPSFAEGLPVVLMEALASARPVISTYVAGIPELVQPGENGWLVPAGDTAALTHAMREAVRAPAAVLDRLGRAGRERVRELHHLDTEVARLEALLQGARGSGA